MDASQRVEPSQAYDDHILVHCPRCDERAIIDAASGFVRLTCPSCGYVREEEPKSPADMIPASSLAVYNDGHTEFGAKLWLETTCCGGHRLWALNVRHLDYIERFVRSTDRDSEFPSLPGHRQLADKLPPWMVSHKHREEVTRAIDRLRLTL